MIRAAAAAGLVFLASMSTLARAQAPRAYTLRTEGEIAPGRKMTVTIVRDGARERVVRRFDGSDHASTTLYDFEARRVYWLGGPGEGTCTFGRYLSARAPVDEDPVTGSAQWLSNLTAGRSREAAGTGSVAGRPARIEAFAGGERSGDPDAPWPTRVWLAADGGLLLRLEGKRPDGQLATIMEVTQLTFGTPAGPPLQPPSPCTETDAELDDTGLMRAHGEGTSEVKVSVEANLGEGTTSAAATRTAGKSGGRPRPGAPAKLADVTLSADAQPHGDPCGTRLQVTATFVVDGPATVSYRLSSSPGGVTFPGGQSGSVTLDAAGSASVVKEATFRRSLAGTLHLQAKVEGTKGQRGGRRAASAVPFRVTCAGR